MKYIMIIILGLVLARPVCGNEEQFIDWWKNHDDQMGTGESNMQHHRAAAEFRFADLIEYAGEIAKPPTIAGEIEKTFILHAQKNFTILLVTPENSMKGIMYLNEEFKQAIKRCADDRSWIVVLPQNRWSELDLSPYCSMHYEEAEIGINLYWTDSSTKPLIDVVTDDLTCVPHQLYVWEQKKQEYILHSRKCTGGRTVESYSGTDLRFQQLN